MVKINHAREVGFDEANNAVSENENTDQEESDLD